MTCGKVALTRFESGTTCYGEQRRESVRARTPPTPPINGPLSAVRDVRMVEIPPVRPDAQGAGGLLLTVLGGLGSVTARTLNPPCTIFKTKAR